MPTAVAPGGNYTVRIKPKQKYVTIVIQALGDAVDESIETMTFSIVPSNQFVLPQKGTLVNSIIRRADRYGEFDFRQGNGSTASVSILDRTIMFAQHNAVNDLADKNPNGISYNDIRQGALGDCWFLASLAAVAHRHPAIIKDRIKEKVEDGVTKTTVQFYGDKAALFGLFSLPVWADVEMEGNLVQGDAQSQLSTDSEAASDGKFRWTRYEVWVNLYEKAFLKQYGSSYNLLDGGLPHVALRHLSGKDTTMETFDPAAPGNALTDLVKSKSDKMMVAGTRRFDPGEKPVVSDGTRRIPLVPTHAYTVLEIDQARDRVRLYNPWGFNVNRNDSGEFTISFADFKKYFVSVSYEKRFRQGEP